MNALKHGAKHAEAFCLMHYCFNSFEFEFLLFGGRVEIVWNSRDGVTPFCIRCRHCGGEMTHVCWERDVYAPDYKPFAGQRVFVGDPDKPRIIVWRDEEG